MCVCGSVEGGWGEESGRVEVCKRPGGGGKRGIHY